MSSPIVPMSEESILTAIDLVVGVIKGINQKTTVEEAIRTLLDLSKNQEGIDPWRANLLHEAAELLANDGNALALLQKARKPLMEVLLLGRGQVLVNGNAITSWDGALPRNLFFYLISSAPVSRDEIFRAFWPDLSVKEATNVFHVTKRKINERLVRSLPDNFGTVPDFTEYYKLEKRYRLSDQYRFKIDYWEVVKIYEDLFEGNVIEDARLMNVLDLFKGDFLTTVPNALWAKKLRAEAKKMQVTILSEVALRAEQREKFELAASTLERALKVDWNREDLVQRLIKALLRTNQPEKAVSVYVIFEKKLSEELGITPSKATRVAIEPALNR